MTYVVVVSPERSEAYDTLSAALQRACAILHAGGTAAVHESSSYSYSTPGRLLYPAEQLRLDFLRRYPAPVAADAEAKKVKRVLLDLLQEVDSDVEGCPDLAVIARHAARKMPGTSERALLALLVDLTA